MTQSEQDSLYREAWAWLTERGFIYHADFCRCPSCHTAVMRYFS